MKSTGRAALVALIASLAFWSVVSVALGGQEPWDAAGFWTVIYPAALALSAVLGLMFPSRAWAWGAIVIFAQIHIVVLVPGEDLLLRAGALFAVLLSIPAVLVSWIAGAVRRCFDGTSVIG